MTFCGMKISHDAAWTLIEDDQLVSHIELEKLANNVRSSEWFDLSEPIVYFDEVFSNKSYLFSADGWWSGKILHFNYRINEGNGFSTAPYDISTPFHNQRYGPFIFGNISYYAYSHVMCHLLSAYCLSPFPSRNEGSIVCVWDGGIGAKLFWIEPKCYGKKRTIVWNQIGEGFPHNVGFFNRISLFAGPVKETSSHITEAIFKGCLRVRKMQRAGTLMSYAALGTPHQEIENILYDNLLVTGRQNILDQWVSTWKLLKNFSDEDIIASTFSLFGKGNHTCVTNAVKTWLKIHKKKPLNFIMTGGAGLNIKWNSAFRDSGLFSEVWVSPLPNDAGNSIGAACGEMIYHTRNFSLDWDIFSGPSLLPISSSIGSFYSLKDLAKLIFESGEPIVFLHGKAEIGPRALGHRSILANPFPSKMKDVLNSIKGRQTFRPVAPICLEDHIQNFFNPGIPDPYMIFEQKIHESKKDLIPAVAHIDGTSRVQAVSKNTDNILYDLLTEYYKLSRIPMLCNTSANLPGRGFFQDLESVRTWGKVRYCWYEGKLIDFTKEK